MRHIFLICCLMLVALVAEGQTCTISIANNPSCDAATPCDWATGGGGLVCDEGGTLSATTANVIIATGTYVEMMSAGDSWSGTSLIINGYLETTKNNNNLTATGAITINGEFYMSAGNPTITSGTGITIGDGGEFNIDVAPTIVSDVLVDDGGLLYVNGNATINGDLVIGGDNSPTAEQATVNITNNAQFTVNGNVYVGTSKTLTDDLLYIEGKLNIGSSTDCGFALYVYGTVNATNAGNEDRLTICNQTIFKGTGGGDCTSIVGKTPEEIALIDPPYCLDNTFSGPLSFDDDGYLPVELTYFKAKHLGDQNLCEWQTASEYNNSHFEVQRSFDGATFSTIGTVDGAGTSYDLQNYQFYDPEIRTGITYYRLKQVDFDGAFAYSKVVSVAVDVDVVRPTLFPNPIVAEQFTVAIPQGAIEQVAIYSILGQEVKSASYAGEMLRNVSIDMAGYAKGKYVVRVVTSAGTFVDRVVKM